MNTPKTIIFIGKQGSGKGTQASRIEELLKATGTVLHVQTGAAFREFAASDSSYTSRKVKESLEKGNIQPSFLASWLWANQFITGITTGEEHILADGFPRRIDQAEDLESAFEFYNRTIVDVVNLEIPNDVAVTRLLSRGRNDDTEEGIKRRLEWYEAETTPVLDFFKERPRYVVHTIDGTKDVDAVSAEIQKVLGL